MKPMFSATVIVLGLMLLATTSCSPNPGGEGTPLGDPQSDADISAKFPGDDVHADMGTDPGDRDDVEIRRKVGIVTIGQSPRSDVVPEMKRVLGRNVEILECGALDEYTLEDMKQFESKTSGGGLVTRMRDGTEVGVSHKLVDAPMQQCITELEKQGVDLNLVLCTGGFEPFESERLVVYPSDILSGAVRGALKRGKLAVVNPTRPSPERLERLKARQEAGDARWGEQVEVVYDGASPYGSYEEFSEMAERVAGEDVDLIFLNCMGFNSRHEEIMSEKTGKPVVLSSSMVARSLKELLR